SPCRSEHCERATPISTRSPAWSRECWEDATPKGPHRQLNLLVGSFAELPPAAGPVQTVRPRVLPGCRPRRPAPVGGGGASGGACWGGRGRRGGVQRPL